MIRINLEEFEREITYKGINYSFNNVSTGVMRRGEQPWARTKLIATINGKLYAYDYADEPLNI